MHSVQCVWCLNAWTVEAYSCNCTRTCVCVCTSIYCSSPASLIFLLHTATIESQRGSVDYLHMYMYANWKESGIIFLSIDMWLNGNETFHAHPFQCVQFIIFNFSVSICFRFVFVFVSFFLCCYRCDSFCSPCQLIRIDWVCFCVLYMIDCDPCRLMTIHKKRKKERKREIGSKQSHWRERINCLSKLRIRNETKRKKSVKRHSTLTLLPCNYASNGIIEMLNISLALSTVNTIKFKEAARILTFFFTLFGFSAKHLHSYSLKCVPKFKKNKNKNQQNCSTFTFLSRNLQSKIATHTHTNTHLRKINERI